MMAGWSPSKTCETEDCSRFAQFHTDRYGWRCRACHPRRCVVVNVESTIDRGGMQCMNVVSGADWAKGRRLCWRHKPMPDSTCCGIKIDGSTCGVKHRRSPLGLVEGTLMCEDCERWRHARQDAQR